MNGLLPAEERGSREPVGGRDVGRPRSREADRKILDAALALMRERGPEAVTIEGVATVSGTAKTTIYRRYGNSDELRDAALGSIVAEVPTPAEGSIPKQLRAMLVAFQYGIEERIGCSAVATLFSDPDSSFARAMRKHILEPRTDALTRVIESAQRDGHVRPEVDPRAVVRALAGSYFTEVMITGRISPTWMDDAMEVIGIGREGPLVPQDS